MDFRRQRLEKVIAFTDKIIRLQEDVNSFDKIQMEEVILDLMTEVRYLNDHWGIDTEVTLNIIRSTVPFNMKLNNDYRFALCQFTRPTFFLDVIEMAPTHEPPFIAAISHRLEGVEFERGDDIMIDDGEIKTAEFIGEIEAEDVRISSLQGWEKFKDPLTPWYPLVVGKDGEKESI